MDTIYLFHKNFNDLPPPLQNSAYRSFYNLVFDDITYLLDGDHILTEDIIQECFIKVIYKVNKQKINNSTAWLRKVARNHTFDYLKKNYIDRQASNITKVSEKKFSHTVQQISIEGEVEEKQRDKLLQESIAELKPDYQTVITLFYIEELSHKEISVLLGLSECAVSQKLARARKKLFQHFNRKWIDK
ncbi:sigma-70 family RNA polymerase sigma factor [Paenibacillus polysaccharolyticus]|uniref:RNA polymerase sigma factor n=1 Tax=Paenibacillus polysaccharolyticus TaxID=582692 RepID=UPI0020407BE4|nr:sigma-70 family RNA polymerase sigma factor [Paenibacillus polysaccharolyticus]MCM3134873.1 sigma-70 family RNA polymerase sigma factor [Paenibacillus polysaccharolyticus]